MVFALAFYQLLTIKNRCLESFQRLIDFNVQQIGEELIIMGNGGMKDVERRKLVRRQDLAQEFNFRATAWTNYIGPACER